MLKNRKAVWYQSTYKYISIQSWKRIWCNYLRISQKWQEVNIYKWYICTYILTERICDGLKGGRLGISQVWSPGQIQQYKGGIDDCIHWKRMSYNIKNWYSTIMWYISHVCLNNTIVQKNCHIKDNLMMNLSLNAFHFPLT